MTGILRNHTSQQILWWIVCALLAVVILLGEHFLASLDHRMTAMEELAIVKLPDHSEFRRDIAALKDRVDGIDSGTLSFRKDVADLRSEMSTLRTEIATFRVLLAGKLGPGNG